MGLNIYHVSVKFVVRFYYNYSMSLYLIAYQLNLIKNIAF